MLRHVLWLWVLRGTWQSNTLLQDTTNIVLEENTFSITKLQFENDLATRGEEVVMSELKDEIRAMGSWAAVKERFQNPVEMFKRVHFREKYVLDLLAHIKRTHNLHFTWPDDPPGSRSQTSDFDLTIMLENKEDTNHFTDDVKAASFFFQEVKNTFHASPAKIFDTNIYLQNFEFKFFRRSSLHDKATQDVAALTKIRRYMRVAEWESFVDSIGSAISAALKHNKQPNSDWHTADLWANLDEADAKHILYRKALFQTLTSHDTALQQQLQRVRTDDAAFELMESAIQNADVDRVYEAEYALYLNGMEKVRMAQATLRRTQLRPPNPDPSSDETRWWMRDKEAQREKIKLLTAEAGYFAPEAYSSEGAFFHIVQYEQAGNDVQILDRLKLFELFCSMNEQAGDFLKDVNYHYTDDSITALVQSSKYLKRFYSAIAVLNQKMTRQIETLNWKGVPQVKEMVSALQPLVNIRRANASKATKNRAALRFITHNHSFRELLGRDIAEIASTVREHLTAVNAEFRTLCPVRPASPCRRRLSIRRHLTTCGPVKEYRLSFPGDADDKIIAQTTDSDDVKQRIELRAPASKRSATNDRTSILTVALWTKKLASRVRGAVASLGISDIARQMVEQSFSPELTHIFRSIKRHCTTLVGHVETTPRARSQVDSVPQMNMLNSGMFVLALSHVLQGMRAPKESGELSKVQFAIGLQMYVNLAGSATLVLADVERFGHLVALEIAQGALNPIEEVLSALTNSLHAVGTVELAVGGLLLLANIGFDIYELWEARNEMERNVAISQLTFDSAGAALLGTSMALSSLEAVSASVVLGSFFVPLAGLGIGISLLVGAFAEIGAKASQVGWYFGKLREGYERGAYHVENGRYVPNAYSVIEKIDFRTRIVTMGSPYMSKSTHGSTGSGRMNYFFWVGDQPKCNLDVLRNAEKFDSGMEWRKDVFDLRARMERSGCVGCRATHELPPALVNHGVRSPSVFVLPISPQSIISYNYFTLPGATTRNDFGFQTLRDMEGTDFDFDYYVFPSEYIIDRMHQHFLDTTVTLVMNEERRVLVAPKHERDATGAWNKVSYHIVGSGALTEICLQNGVHFVLQSPPGSVDVLFLLDSTTMGGESVDPRVEDSTIRLGELSISFSALTVTSRVYLRSKQGIWLLDIANNAMVIAVTNVPSSSSGSPSDVMHLMENLIHEHRTAARFVSVNVTLEGTNRHIVYDTHQHILVYTRDPTPSDTILLGVQSKEFGCFASPSQCRVWCTNFTTHDATVETESFCLEPSEFTFGGFMFVADKRAIIDITRVSEPQSMKESVHYRYLLSESNCWLVDIRHFAPMMNHVSESHSSALDRRPRSTDSGQKIGRNPHKVLATDVYHWVTYERRVFDAQSEQQERPLLDQRSWYNMSTHTLIILDASKESISLEHLTFMPLAHRTVSASSRRSERDVLFHDSLTAQVFRYAHVPNRDDGTLVLVRADIVRVASSRSKWFGVSLYGSVVEFLSATQFRIIGYTLDIFDTNQNAWSSWWNDLRVEERASAPIIPFYDIGSGIIKNTRRWYLREADSYVILDHHFNENGTVNCVGVTENKADAILVTEDGVMWVIGVLRASDIPSLSIEWNPQKEPVKWTPSTRIHTQATIVHAQWDARGTMIKTANGLVILAHDLTNVSAEFTLRRVESSRDSNTVELAYRIATDLRIRMPVENFVPVRIHSRQAYLYKVNGSRHVRVVTPDHHGVPLGVDDTDRTMLFCDAATRACWKNDTPFDATVDFIVRFKDVLLATSSDEHVVVPRLFGVTKIAMELLPGVKKMTVPRSYHNANELAIDTRNMTEISVVEVLLPWEAEDFARIALHDVGDEDTTVQMVVLHMSGKSLRWQGRSFQRLITLFAAT